MAKFQSKSLIGKMIRLLFLTFSVSLLLLILLIRTGTEQLQIYFIQSDFIYKAEQSYIEKLSSYVEKNNIPATDFMSFYEWTAQNSISHLTISRDRVLIFDSSYPRDVIFGQADTEYIHETWMYFHTVTFADGPADVYINANFELKYYYIFYLFSIALAVFVWVLLFTLGIRKEVLYIQQLSRCVTSIENGSFDQEFQVKGSDELSHLARGLDQMRLALIEKERTEKEMKSAQDHLVLGMAHDLRTPLTGLTTFLEIAKKQPTLEESTRYIDRAYAKAIQMRDLSDQLFEYFLINSEQPMKLEQPEDVEYALGEYLSELCALLEADGYRILIDRLYWKPVQIQVCTDYIGRIIDNLISNIQKYADPNQPIELISEYDAVYAGITIANKPLLPNQYVHGTGIGVKNIHTMMLQMNGQSAVSVEPDGYSIILRFPIA